MSADLYAQWRREQREHLVFSADLKAFDFLEACTPDQVARDLTAHLSSTEIALLHNHRSAA